LSPRARRRLTWTGAIALALATMLGLSLWRAAQAEARATSLSALAALKTEVVLAPRGFEALAPRGADFAVDSDRTVFLATDQGPAAFQQLAGGVERLRTAKPLDSLAVGQDDTLITVSGGYLGVASAQGEAYEALPLPRDDLRLAPGNGGSVYLYGGHGSDFRVYRFQSDYRYDVLAKTDAPIVGVAETGNDLLIATARHVIRLTAQGPQMVFKAPADPAFGPITSVAGSPDGLVFIATADRVYAALAGNAVSIVNDSGGALRWRDGRLYVLDPIRRLVYALSPADRTMFAETSR